MEDERANNNSTPERQIGPSRVPNCPPPLFRMNVVARMTQEECDRMYLEYYLERGIRIEEIPPNPYDVRVARQREWEWGERETQRQLRRGPQRTEEEQRQLERERQRREEQRQRQLRRELRREVRRQEQRMEEEERQRVTISEEHLKKGEGEDQCSVCLSPFKISQPARRLRCDHLYHSECINEWFMLGHLHCPLCRRGADIFH